MITFRRSRVSLLLFIFAFGAEARVRSVGKDPMPAPDATCILFDKTGYDFCSGTIAIVEPFKDARLITAGHCFEGLLPPVAPYKAHCGCKEGGAIGPDGKVEAGTCKEVFDLDVVESHANGIVDHADVTLKKPPVVVTPLTGVLASELFDEAGKIKAGWSCIKGGYGIKETGNDMRREAAYFKVATDQVTITGNGIQFREKVGTTDFFTHGQAGPLCDAKAYAANPSGGLFQYYFNTGIVMNTILPGDSGAGLLCKFGDGPYRLAGMAIDGIFENDANQILDINMFNTFSVLPTYWSPKLDVSKKPELPKFPD